LFDSRDLSFFSLGFLIKNITPTKTAMHINSATTLPIENPSILLLPFNDKLKIFKKRFLNFIAQFFAE